MCMANVPYRNNYNINDANNITRILDNRASRQVQSLYFIRVPIAILMRLVAIRNFASPERITQVLLVPTNII